MWGLWPGLLLSGKVRGRGIVCITCSFSPQALGNPCTAFDLGVHSVQSLN